MNNHILIAGATGRTGRIIVQKLLAQGKKPHLLVRDLSEAKALFGDSPIYFQSDVREPNTLSPAMTEVDTVISAIGTRTPVGKNCPKHVDYEGVANLVHVAKANGIRRFILISSIAVTRPDHPLNCFGRILDWKKKGEEVLRQSGLDYAIIRPGGLLNTPGGNCTLIVDQGDRLSGTISREDVAEICLMAAHYPQPLQVTFEVIQSEHPSKNVCMPALETLTMDASDSGFA